MQSPLLEVCVEDARCVKLAERGGAARVELCASLALDGLTPDAETMRAAREGSKLPILAMIRPRGGDFRYESDELERMQDGIRSARDCGMDGFVFGALRPDGSVDLSALEGLMECSAGLPVTFHRAFDCTADPEAALEELVALGVSRILTAGRAPSALEGAERIAGFVQCAAGRLSIIAGGGVRAENLQELQRSSGALEFHSSLGGSSSLSIESVDELVQILHSTTSRK